MLLAFYEDLRTAQLSGSVALASTVEAAEVRELPVEGVFRKITSNAAMQREGKGVKRVATVGITRASKLTFRLSFEPLLYVMMAFECAWDTVMGASE